MTVEGDGAAFGLSDLEKVAADSGEADGLSGGSASVGGGHFFQVEKINAERE